MWFYSKFNLKLEHSATAQMYSGEHTKEPLPGDVVSFSHGGSEVAYHNGIYIGAGLFIHSPRPGAKTRLSLVDEYMDGNPEVTYTRLDF
jgi:cell wall-associated NlpC family hydrolase